MKMIKIKDLVDFGRATDKRRKNLARKFRDNTSQKEQKHSKSGGDYWISSTSCIVNVIKTGERNLYEEKIEYLYSKLQKTEYQRTKTMYQRNIDIVTQFLDFEQDLMPKVKYEFIAIPRQSKMIEMEGFPLQVNPQLIYSFEEDGQPTIGSVWVVTKLSGYNKFELGLFCEILYKFLIRNYQKDYQISEQRCTVIETFNALKIDYSELSSGKIPNKLDETLREIRNI